MKILLTGAGSPGAPGVIKCLLEVENWSVIAADMNEVCAGRYLAPQFVKIPAADDPDFIESVLQICRAESVDIVLPLVTKELFAFAQNMHVFSRLGIKVGVSDYESLCILNDKGKLYSHLRKCGLPVPRYAITRDSESLLRAVDSFQSDSGVCVIKPCIGNGSRGVRVISDKFDRLDLLLNEKPGSLSMSQEELEKIVFGRRMPEMLVTEYLPGPEITIDTLHSAGQLHLSLVRNRLKTNSGISVAGEFLSGEHQIRSTIQNLCATLPGLRGAIGFQAKSSEDDVFYLIESNPRIQGTSVASVGLGINFPKVLVDLLSGKPCMSFDLPHKTVGFIRYYSEVFYDAQSG